MTSTNPLRQLVLLSAVALTACLSSCTGLKNVGNNWSVNFDPPAHKPTNPSAVRVKISNSAQRLYVMEGSKVLMVTPCTVGKASTPTHNGSYTIYSKEAKRRSHSYGEYPMAYWCEFASGYGIHWGFQKPYPCTHGCVRLPKWSAAKLFALVNVGTPLNIATTQPEDATVGKTVPTFDDTTLPDPPNSYMMSDQVFQDAVYKGKMFVD